MTEPIKEGSALIHGANIHYRIYGNGPKTLLLLHGNGEDGHCFDKQIPDFSKYFQVITMDSRGHGLSERGPEPLTLDQMSIDAIELLKYLRVKSTSVLGFSDGANIAMLMALKSVYPIEKLSCQLPTILGYGICSLIAKFDKKARTKAEILGLMVKEPRINPDSLGRITAPALILAGERDMIKDKHTKLIARSLPKSTLTIIPKASHFVFGKWAEQTNEVVLNFLRSDSKTVPGHHVSQ